MFASLQTLMLNDNNFIKWLALKAFTINKVSNATQIVTVFVFLYFYKCNLKNPE